MTLGVPAALWGLLVLPVLVALYLLRVRRRHHPVSSVLLWQRSAPTLAALRPARRVERSLLLLLQLIAAAAVVAALARPSLIGQGIGGRDVVLVLDGSLSMRARDVRPSRFEHARAEALDVVRHLRPGQRAAVVLAGPRPLLLAALTGDRARVASALRAAQPWDAAGDLRAAVTLAAAQQPGALGRIIVWTDAAHGPPPAMAGVTYRLVGESADNVGITEFRVLRDPGPGTAQALVRLENFGGRPHRVPLEVTRGGVRIYAATFDLPAGGSRSTVFPVTGAGVLRARLAVRDMLPEDDAAVAVLDPTPLPSVLLVSRGDPDLERVLRILPVPRASETAAVDPATWGAYGAVILDGVPTGPLPPGNYLLIGTVPPDLPVSATETVAHPEIAAWDRSDPVLRFVNLAGVHVGRALALAPEGGRVLVSGRVPLLWAYEGQGIRALLLGFALGDSDLPRHVAFPLLVANSLAWLGGATDNARVGDEVQVPAGTAQSAVLASPDGRRVQVRSTDGVFVLPAFSRAGLYRLTTPAGEREIAVAIGSPRAGAIRPGRVPAEAAGGAGPAAQGSRDERLAGGGGAGLAGALPSSILVRVPVWPWLLLASVGALAGEWALATRRRGGDA